MNAVSIPRRLQALRSRLPALPAPAAQLLRSAFAQPLRWSSGDLSLCIASATVTPNEAAQLESAHGLARLWVAASPWRDEAGDRPWNEYEGDSRALAWALSHETLLRKLSLLLACEFSVSRLVSGSSSSPLALRWTLRQGELQAQGWLQAEPDLWLKHWLPLAQALPRIGAEAASLPARLAIELPLHDFPAAELAASRPGDVLVLGTRNRAWASLTLRMGQRRWLASWERGQLRVLGALAPQPHLEEPSMSQEATPEAAPAPDHNQAALAAFSVDLSFVLGELKLSVGELANLAPGYVFELPNRLEHAQVLVQAAGRTIGRGELVAVGETLGVQITELKLDGLQ